jgi:Asp-tRNA(Asn)/Glu-tRNA(Gln) amidotransferase A subunit family amidase
MTSMFNYVSQCPALSVPAGWSTEGLPVGLQIVGRRYRDDEVLRVGAALERARPWAHRRPPL